MVLSSEAEHRAEGGLSPEESSSETSSDATGCSVPSTPSEEKETIDRDSMWKTIMVGNFDHMLDSILPELAAKVDRSRRPEFLDKEMKDLKALMGGTWQEPDLLAKVPVKEGRDIWLALHVEVQDKGGEDFPERMFYYHSMIRFKYLKRKRYEEEQAAKASVQSDGKRKMAKERRGVVDVVSMAILTPPTATRCVTSIRRSGSGNLTPNSS